jgi:hypothetical protein
MSDQANEQQTTTPPEQMARRLCELADNPTANGFVPVHPDTLRQAAAAIRQAAKTEIERCAGIIVGWPIPKVCPRTTEDMMYRDAEMIVTILNSKPTTDHA